MWNKNYSQKIKMVKHRNLFGIMQPKVSVIIPVYGVEQYIERCARSLFEQTLDNIEYIFIDDCTPDSSIDILKSVLRDYPNRENQVVIRRMERNSGSAVVRKWGMKHAVGEYVIHCDSDDWVDVNAYKKMYEVGISKDADVVICDYCKTDGISKTTFVGCHDVEKKGFFENLLLKKDLWSLWNKMFKRTFVADDIIWPKGDMSEDALICIQLVYKSNRIAYIPECFYCYFCNPLSITRIISEEAVLRRFRQSVMNGYDMMTFFKQNNIYTRYQDEIDRILLDKKNILRPIIKEKKYYDLWKNTFSEIDYRIFFNKSVSYKMKVRHMLTLMRIC